ncbi:MAG: competence/damage-inducible protein A [Oscillospiraceae bacterium]|nr:competence/damage-inducible protein A [Oscillospiraceae bacterium]
MNTEIISVGTELLLGHVTNTDARDVSEQLAKIGVNVLYHTVVGDNPGRLAQCIEIAKQRADLIITTGGLGPTCDDLTKDILAKSFGLELKRDEAEYQKLYDYISARHAYTENNTKQAMLPEGCTVFHNTCGTAPGCAFEKDGITVIMLPGPPKECLAMLRESVVPYLRKRSGEVIVSHSVRIFGIGESGVDDIFADEMNHMVNPSLAPYAKEADCLLQVTAKASTEAEAEAMCLPVIDHIRDRLGEFVYGIDIDSIEEAAFALLREKHATLAFAESCTGGEAAKRLTDLPGASTVFKGGVVTYTNEAKATLLGIDPDVIETEGAVSYEVAAEMAENVRTILNADLGIGVTGLAGPDGDGVHEVGTVFVSLATENETFVKELHLGSFRTRSFIRRMAGNHIYDMLRRYLSGLSVL